MKIADAVELINHESLKTLTPQTWSDLGCGAGTFTIALAELLTPQSIIYAVDKDRNSLARIPEIHNQVAIKKINANFLDDKLNLPTLDGILMANSLHFVADKQAFLERIEKLTNRFLIVEYEDRTPNPWVPYPINFHSLQKLFKESGFSQIELIGTRKSAFGGEMYAASVMRRERELSTD